MQEDRRIFVTDTSCANFAWGMVILTTMAILATWWATAIWAASTVRSGMPQQTPPQKGCQLGSKETEHMVSVVHPCACSPILAHSQTQGASWHAFSVLLDTDSMHVAEPLQDVFPDLQHLPHLGIAQQV